MRAGTSQLTHQPGDRVRTGNPTRAHAGPTAGGHGAGASF